MFSQRTLHALALLLAILAGTASAALPAPHGQPKIFSVDLPERVFRAGETVHGSVVTSKNVGYVEARVEYRNVPLHQDGPGKFSLSYTIPWLAIFARRGAWTLQIIARSVDGVEVKEYFPITFR